MNLPFLKQVKLPMLSYGTRIDPVRDWLVLLIVFGILLLATLAFHAWLFFTVTRPDQSPDMGAAAEDVSGELLERTRDVFTERAREADRYRSFEFVDPSR